MGRVANPNFDGLVERWTLPVYRFCLLLVQVPRDAQAAAFQTFLYLGAEESPDGWSEGARVFRWALRACEDYYYRRGRRRVRRRELEAASNFPVDGALWYLVNRPLRAKAAFFLLRCLELPPEEAGRALGVSPARAQRLARPGRAYDSRTLAGAAAAIVPDPAWEEGLLDDLYFRFSERSVAVENRLMGLRFAVDRAIPWIALGILLLCAAAVLYTGAAA